MQVLLGVDPGYADMPGRVHQAAQVLNHLAGPLGLRADAVTGLEADRVDGMLNPLYPGLARRNAACPAQFADLLDRVTGPEVHGRGAKLSCLGQPGIDPVDQ